MAKKKPPKKKPSGRLPTGVTKSPPFSQKSSAPDSSSAAKLKPRSDLPLTGSTAQLSQTPSLAQEDPKSSLAKQTETTDLETLAAATPPASGKEADVLAPAFKEAAATTPALQSPSAADLWKGFVKEASGKLEPKETPFLLDSGESCVTIPNEVVEKNKKAWEYFILGQFYEEPPARGAIHAIVNGIWSRHRRDITVNKMDGNAFLFRVPCPNARRRILKQSLWQIDGQTMFVTKWSPGIQQTKPELETVPVWLEFTGVPLQFFNRDALKEIAGMVGQPICLHPATENLTNIEVAKVYTVIDPRKPLPEFVNARFESGDTRRIAVTSPWLPSLCSYCKKFGHTITRCKHAPKTCLTCNSVKHPTALCPRTNHLVAGKEKHERKEASKREGKKPVKSLLPIVGQPSVDPKNANLPVSQRPGGTQRETAAAAPAYKEILTRSPPPSIAENVAPPDSQSHSGSSVSVSHDLSKGSLCVDLSAEGCYEDPQQISTGSSGSSSDTPASEEGEILSDDGDEFIEFFSKRHKKRAKANARARGPLTP
uniref:DUF4283 domain-containing protein n=2 Tax=Brassica campestris TaxID=3711 RepID=A0A3P6BS09_BRACM|nr:unnamed protein product [Brassica rapa]